LKFVSLAILDLLGFNAQNLRGPPYPGHAHFSKKNCQSGVRTIPGGTPAKFKARIFSYKCIPGNTPAKLKFVPSAILELLAFNAPKFTGSHDRDHAHFSEIFVRGHVGTIPGNTPAKFGVRITFSHFGAISI